MVNPCLNYSKAYLGLALPSIIVAGSAPGVATGSGPADGSLNRHAIRCALCPPWLVLFHALAKILARGLRKSSANIDFSEALMPRGIVPRQPAKTGRQEGLRRGPTAGRDRRPRTRPSKPKMPSENQGDKPLAPERIREILRRLDQSYPDVTCALHHNSAWELVVATILSAQCTDVRVNMVTPELFRKYPTVKDFAGTGA